ncbi:hypothetical protein [Bradyrhizobium sp. STM 3562]|uniref:hypothetical protein n=1 Tax=Bradyrhizobium sp. STM 3562 TaxID=578924 RepID=UPI00388F31E2
MADDHLEDLLKARAALVNKRRTLAQTIAVPSDIPENAIRGMIEVQQAIAAIDLAIEELEEEELDEELEEAEEEDEE